MARKPYAIDRDAPVVRETSASYAAIYGQWPRLTATAGFKNADAGLLARTGIAVNMFGPHYTRDEDDSTLSGSAAEHAALDELMAGTFILTDLVR